MSLAAKVVNISRTYLPHRLDLGLTLEGDGNLLQSI